MNKDELVVICQHCGNTLKRATHKNLAYCNDKDCSEERSELAAKHFYPYGARLEISEDGKWMRAVPLNKKGE